MNSISQVLDRNAAVLLEKGQHTRTLCNFAKLVGIGALASGAIACGTGNINPGAAAALSGGVLYVGAAGKELETTGRLMPAPYFGADIGMIVRSATTTGEQAARLTEIDYLSLDEKASLAMATTLKPLTVALDNLPSGEQPPAYHMLKNGLQTLYPEVVANVGIMPALLPEMGGLENVRSQLSQTLAPAHREVFEAAKVPQAIAPSAPSPAQAIAVSNPPAKNATPQRPTAIDVPARTVLPKENMRATVVQAARSVSSTVTALSTIVASPFKSRAWFGGQRTGKSYLAAVASKQLHEKYDTRVFHINLASYGEEDGYYWSHVDAWDSVCCDISAMDLATAGDKISQAVKLVNDFYLCENALLIIDELAYIGSKTNRHTDELAQLMHVIADKIAVLASTGMKRRKALWTLAPEFVASALVKDALAVKKLELVLCAIAPGHKACWKDEQGQNHALSYDWSLATMVGNNFTLSDAPNYSEHSRIVYAGGQWMSAGVSGEELRK